MRTLKKPSIVYFQQNTADGSCEEYLYLLMEGLDKGTFNVDFVCPQSPSLRLLAEKVEGLGVRVYRYPLDAGNMRAILYLRSLFMKLKPDLLHFNDPCLNGIIAARLARVPILVMMHHTPGLDRKYSLKGRFLESIALRHSSVNCIFTSDYDRDTGIKKDGAAQNKSFVIPYGLPPGKFSQRYDKNEVLAEFGLDKGLSLIGHVARLSPQKGQVYFIEAARLVIEKFKAARFFFVGEGALESELKDLVIKNGLKDFFIFTGFRKDIPRLLSAFDMLVMPSLFEGTPFATLEACASGIPIIATPVGGMRYSVIDGKTGIMVPPKDPNALAEAILWMLTHPKEAQGMGTAAKKRFNEYFTQEKMARATQGLYMELLKNTQMKQNG